MSTGVYQIINILNGKRYIGSAARSFDERFYLHKHQLQLGTHDNPKLQRGWDKHGGHNFKFEILEECPPELCIEREQYYIDTLHKRLDYNICHIAGSWRGNKHSALTKKKLSKTHKGKKLSAETRAKMSLARLGAKNPNFGKKMSEEQQALMIEGRRKAGKMQTFLGQTHTEEAKIKMQACRGAEHHWSGRQHSPETIQKMKEAWLRRKQSQT